MPIFKGASGKIRVQSEASRSLDHLLLVLSSISSFLLLVWLLRWSIYGLDLTDEGFYLTWIADPFLYDWSITQFGFVYHPLYLFVDGNISMLRQINIIVTFTLAWALVATVLLQVSGSCRSNIGIWVLLAAGFAPAALLVFDSWMLTPRYQSLNLQAFLVTAIGLVLAQKVRTQISVLGWMLIGLGGGLCFLAKPSSAGILAIIAFAYLWISRKICVLILVTVTGVTIFLTVCALAIDGSVVTFAKRIAMAVNMTELLDSGHQIGRMVRLDRLQLNISEQWIVLTTTGLTTTLLFLAECSDDLARRFGMIIAGIFFLPVCFFIFFSGTVHVELGQFRTAILLAVPFAGLLGTLIKCGVGKFNVVLSSSWALLLTLAFLPYGYAFGTNNNYWRAAGLASIFWVLIGVVLGVLREEGRLWRQMLPLAFAVQFLVALVLHASMEQPYRQSRPLWENSHHLNIGGPGSTLMVGEEQGRFLETAVTSARRAGFQSGYRVIDLTGRSPGVLYALKASPVGQPWIIGGYPGSVRVAVATLAYTACTTIANAWVLTEPKGPRRIAETALSSVGIDLKEHYEQAASWQTAGESGSPHDQHQVLWKPTRERLSAIQACLTSQQEQSQHSMERRDFGDR